MTFHTQIAPGSQAGNHAHSVDKTQTVDTNPPGGLDRLFASGVHLSDEQIGMIRRSQSADIDPNVPVTYAWPTEIERLRCGGVAFTGITKCSLCNRLHCVGLSADPLRRPECSDGFPPFHNGRQKPSLVRILPVLDVLPDDLIFEMRAEKSDLATFVKIALQTGEPVTYGELAANISELRSLARYRSTTRWRRHHSEAAFQAIVRSRVLEERICIIADGADLPEPQRTYLARRQALAQFVRGHGPGKMRLRFARALYAALKAAGRGEL